MSTDRRRQLLDGAVAVFAHEGIDSGNTSAVARKAGVAAGTLFNYFRSKTDLVRAAYLDCKTRAAEAMKASIRPDASELENLRLIWKGAIAWHLENPEATAFMEQFRNSPAFDQEVADQAHAAFAFMFEIVGRAQATGSIADLPQDFLEKVYTALFLTTVGYMREARLASDDPFVDRSFAVLRQAISPES